MDREKLIPLLNRYYNGQITTNDIYNILYDYCIEQGKDEYNTKQFLNIIINSAVNEIPILSIAVEYYEHKFSVCKVIKERNLYEANISNNKILLVY